MCSNSGYMVHNIGRDAAIHFKANRGYEDAVNMFYSICNVARTCFNQSDSDQFQDICTTMAVVHDFEQDVPKGKEGLYIVWHKGQGDQKWLMLGCLSCGFLSQQHYPCDGTSDARIAFQDVFRDHIAKLGRGRPSAAASSGRPSASASPALWGPPAMATSSSPTMAQQAASHRACSGVPAALARCAITDAPSQQASGPHAKADTASGPSQQAITDILAPPPPVRWTKHTQLGGKTYYHDHEEKVSTYDAGEWVKQDFAVYMDNPAGGIPRFYYVNKATKTSQWDEPGALMTTSAYDLWAQGHQGVPLKDAPVVERLIPPDCKQDGHAKEQKTEWDHQPDAEPSFGLAQPSTLPAKPERTDDQCSLRTAWTQMRNAGDL